MALSGTPQRHVLETACASYLKLLELSDIDLPARWAFFGRLEVDILEKKREANKGQVPKYYVEDSHEAIIPKDIFLKVQEEIARRANLTKGTTKRKRIYSGRYALSGIVFCAHCGDIFRRIKWYYIGC